MARPVDHFGSNLPDTSVDWCKTPSLLTQSLDWYWQNYTQL